MPNAFQRLAGLGPFLALLATGLVFGLAIDVGRIGGAVLRSKAMILFAPIIIGAGIGALEGILVPTELWGFSRSVVYRTLNERIVSGAVVGLILYPPTIKLSIAIRRKPSLGEFEQRYAAMSNTEFAAIERTELTETAREAYDRAVKRRRNLPRA